MKIRRVLTGTVVAAGLGAVTFAGSGVAQATPTPTAWLDQLVPTATELPMDLTPEALLAAIDENLGDFNLADNLANLEALRGAATDTTKELRYAADQAPEAVQKLVDGLSKGDLDAVREAVAFSLTTGIDVVKPAAELIAGIIAEDLAGEAGDRSGNAADFEALVQVVTDAVEQAVSLVQGPSVGLAVAQRQSTPQLPDLSEFPAPPLSAAQLDVLRGIKASRDVAIGIADRLPAQAKALAVTAKSDPEAAVRTAADSVLAVPPLVTAPTRKALVDNTRGPAGEVLKAVDTQGSNAVTRVRGVVQNGGPRLGVVKDSPFFTPGGGQDCGDRPDLPGRDVAKDVTDGVQKNVKDTVDRVVKRVTDSVGDRG